MKNNISKLLREGLMEISNEQVIEESILKDLIPNNINESFNFDRVISKLKGYAKKGLITSTILMGLLSNDAFSQEQKNEITNIAQTELSQEEVEQVKNQLHSKTGLEFNDDYVKNNIQSKEGSPILPSSDELMSVVVKDGGVRKEFIDNIYIDTNYDREGNENNVLISVRLQNPTRQERLKQANYRNEIYKRVVSSLKTYGPKGEKSIDGRNLAVKVLDSEDNIINGREVNFKN